jgi:hypothetical protein
MNNVSTLLWVADIVANLQVPLIFLCIVTSILAAAPFVAAIIGETEDAKQYFVIGRDKHERREVTYTEYMAAEYGHKDWERQNIYVRFFPKARRWALLTIPLFLIVLSAAVARPTKSTVLAIAASEFTEEISLTPIGGEVGELALDTLKLLRQKLNEQLLPPSTKEE